MSLCADCQGRGWYWAEEADQNPEMAALILLRPDPDNGLVLIACPSCSHSWVVVTPMTMPGGI